MWTNIQFARIFAFAITLIAILLVILPSPISEIWTLEPWLLIPFRIIANLVALLACSISLVLIWKFIESHFLSFAQHTWFWSRNAGPSYSLARICRD